MLGKSHKQTTVSAIDDKSRGQQYLNDISFGRREGETEKMEMLMLSFFFILSLHARLNGVRSYKGHSDI